MENLLWILVVIVLAGVVIWYLKGKKKGPAPMREPEEPTPPSPPEEPTI